MSSKHTQLVVLFALIIPFCGLLAFADQSTAKHDAIREALDGKAPENPSSDGVFDDVLQVIKDRGSVLDGSVLDASVLDQRPGIADEKSSVAERATVAEQLLKASRLLERVAGSDGDRVNLVKRMRGEAAKLLSE